MDSFIIFGNCIAAQIYHQIKNIPLLHSKYEFLYVNSYKLQRNEDYESMRPKVKGCQILLEQSCLEGQKSYNDPYFPDRALLPKACKIVRFPALRFPVFWPVQLRNSRNKPEADLPAGRFPFSDRLLESLLRKGFSPEKVIENYLSTDFPKYAGLDRMLELTVAQYKRLDRESDISFTEEILNNFRSSIVFLDHVHPAPEYFKKFILKLLEAVDIGIDSDGGKNMTIGEHVECNIKKAKPFDHFHMPINPAIGRHFKIPWIDESRKYNYPPFGQITFMDYLKAYSYDYLKN